MLIFNIDSGICGKTYILNNIASILRIFAIFFQKQSGIPFFSAIVIGIQLSMQV